MKSNYLILANVSQLFRAKNLERIKCLAISGSAALFLLGGTGSGLLAGQQSLNAKRAKCSLQFQDDLLQRVQTWMEEHGTTLRDPGPRLVDSVARTNGFQPASRNGTETELAQVLAANVFRPDIARIFTGHGAIQTVGILFRPKDIRQLKAILNRAATYSDENQAAVSHLDDSLEVTIGGQRFVMVKDLGLILKHYSMLAVTFAVSFAVDYLTLNESVMANGWFERLVIPRSNLYSPKKAAFVRTLPEMVTGLKDSRTRNRERLERGLIRENIGAGVRDRVQGLANPRGPLNDHDANLYETTSSDSQYRAGVKLDAEDNQQGHEDPYLRILDLILDGMQQP